MPRDTEPVPGGVPKGLHTATPYLVCGDAAGAIDFYKEVFGATELISLADPNGNSRASPLLRKHNSEAGLVP